MAAREVWVHGDMDAPASLRSEIQLRTESMEVESVAGFVEHVNKTVGKHFRCCICFSILEDPVMLPCNHSLCRGCAMQAMRQYRRCPQCLADIPNLRALQGRNKWITSMVESLRDCLNEVGVSLTQHAPVPAKYQNARPPPPRKRAGTRSRGQTSAVRRTRSPSPPPISCGERGGASAARSLGRGARSGAKRKRAPPARSSAAEEEAARSPASSRDRDTSGERVVRSQSDVRRSQAGACISDHVDGVVAQPSEGGAERVSSSDDAPLPPAPLPPPFAVGDLVSVDHRTWPGMNKYGGVGFVCVAYNPPGSLYDIKYTLTQKVERGVDGRFVHPYAFLDDAVRSRSRQGTGSPDIRRTSRRIGRITGSASGPIPTRERTAAYDVMMTSDIAGNAALTTDPLRTPTCRDASKHAPTGSQAPPNRDALEAGEGRNEEGQNKTTESSVAEQGRGSDTTMATIGRERRANLDGARIEQSRDVVEQEKDRRGAAKGYKVHSNGFDQRDDDSGVTLTVANGEGVCGSSGVRPRRDRDTVEEKKNHQMEEVPLQTNESGSADYGEDSDTTLIIASEEEEIELSDDAELRPCGGGSPEGTTEVSDGEVNQGRPVPRGIDPRSPVVSNKQKHHELNRSLAAEARKLENEEGEPGRREIVAGPRQRPRQGLTLGSIVPKDRQGERDRRGVPLQPTRGSSEIATRALTAVLEDDLGSTEGGETRSPSRCPAVKNPSSSEVGIEVALSPRFAGQQTRKLDGSLPRRYQTVKMYGVESDRPTSGPASDVFEDATPSGPPSETGNVDVALRGSNCRSSASAAPSTPDESAKRSQAESQLPPRQMMPPPPPSPSPSLKTPFYKAGDLVDVLSRSSPGVNKEGGVARVTRVNADGTYDVKYCVRHGTEKAVNPAIMSPYTLDDECDTVRANGGSDGNRGGERQALAPSPSAASVSVRRTHRRGSCPPDAAVGQANAACLNLILGDTQHPGLDLDPGLVEDLDPETRRQHSGNTLVGMEGGSVCVSGSNSAACGKGKGNSKERRDPRCDAKRKNVEEREDEKNKSAVGSKQGVGGKRTREGETGRRPAPRDNASAVASSSDSGGGAMVAAASDPRRGRERRVVLTLSSLTPEMVAVAESLAASHSWRIVPKYTEDVTHVVCGAAPRTNKANIRSAKFLRAVASGKWVVNEGWLQESQLRGEHVKEEAFELSGDRKSTVPSAPRRSRLAHAEPDRPGLFCGTTFHLRGHFGKDSPPLCELEAMLLANGGTVVRTIGALFAQGGGGSSGSSGSGRRDSKGSCSSGTWRPPRVVIFQPSASSTKGDVQTLARDLALHTIVGPSPGSEKVGRRDRAGGAKQEGDHVEVVKPSWLVDSVGCFRVLQPTVVHRVQLPHRS